MGQRAWRVEKREPLWAKEMGGSEAGARVAVMLLDRNEGAGSGARACWLVRLDGGDWARRLAGELRRFEARSPSHVIRAVGAGREEEWLSAEAARESALAGVRMAVCACGPAGGEQGPRKLRKGGWLAGWAKGLAWPRPKEKGPEEGASLDSVRAVLMECVDAGLALGPAELGAREDGRLYEADAAAACRAFSELWEMREEGLGAGEGKRPLGRGARL